MARKRKLSDLIGEETQQSERTSEAFEVSSPIESTVNNSVTAEVSDSVTNKVSDIQSNKVTELRTTKVTDSKSCELPKYLKLVRKEARLRSDQLDSLTSLTRLLNRQRKGSGERITENTLIRVAVDLLMNQSDKLKGTTEQELRKSVSLKVTD